MPAHSGTALSCVHQLIEQQVSRTPHAPAVTFEDDTLSFIELNTQANRLAKALRTCGIGPEALVAVFVERSLDLAVAVLGVLKAGGAYVPLDTEQQSRRQAFILEDCQPLVIVTQSNLKTQLPVHQATVMYVDSYTAESTDDGEGNTDSGVEAANLAYIMYTSGSTGTPKGVAIEHRHLLNYLVSTIDQLDLETGASYAMVQPLAVDSSVTAFYPAWIRGGTVHIISRERSLDPDRLCEYLRRHPVDYLKIAPSHLEALLGGSGSRDLLPRKCLVIGGESSSWGLVDKVQNLAPQCVVFNHYGPTEATVGVTTCRLDGKQQNRATTNPPIGRPLAHTQVYVLNERQQPVPVGIVGELFIGGNQVARGYFRQPELTARAFIADPFSTVPHARLYRTGDLVRCLPDGNLEFIGRADRQLKVRGFRVEPGEIESVLSEHAAIRQAAIESYKDMAGRNRLIAYVVPEPTHIPTPYHLLRYLSQRLPSPMVPSSVIFLDVLPLSSHGKIDRKALPLPETQRTCRERQLAPPQTSAETALLEIWQDVLGLAPIGVNENFFDLGGESLLAVALLTRVRQVFTREVSIQALFDSPTVESLAKVLRIGTNSTTTVELLPIATVPRDQDLPLSFAQERIWFIHQTNPETIAYSYGTKLCFEGDLDVAALEKSLTEEVRRHEIYRTSFHDLPTGPVQRVHPPWPVDLPIVDLSAWPVDTRKAEAERQIDALVKQPFDLDHTPLVRWTLLRLDTRTHLLIHVENHLVHDGWSADLFVQELIDLYNAFSEGKPSPLIDPPIQYGDFACWEREWIQKPAADRQREFWKRTLNGCQSHLHLPVDRSRPVWQTYAGQRHIMTLGDTKWQKLCDMARMERVTPFMVMLATFYVLLSRYTGQTDLNVGTGVANRRRPEVEGILGMFINNLVLRLNVPGNPSFRVLVRRVRDVVLQAFAHQELPFNHVVETVAGQRDMSRNPLYQAMFSFHDRPMPDLSTRNMRVTREPTLVTGTSKFDLGVIVYPAAIRDAEADLPATEGSTWMIWEYSSELFDATTIERMASHFQSLLDQAISDPSLTQAELSPLTLPERKQLLEEWNDTRADYPENGCVHELFEAQVLRAPDAVALVFEQERLTYRELNERANQLAHYLRGLGIGPEMHVGLCVERSLEMVVGIMGILKAGSVYVPLDPEYPKERLAFMLADAQIRMVLTQYSLLNRLPEVDGQTVCLDRDWQTIRAQPSANATNDLTPEDVAYVIYTSGSTGKPKGVTIPHSAISRNCRIMADHYRLRSSDRVLQFSRFSFDQSLDQILLPLSFGASVVLPSEDILDPTSLTNILSYFKVTVLNLPPAYWRQWVQALTDQGKQSYSSELRLVSVGGDVVPPDSVRMWNKLSISRSAKLLNAYGPTEATITTTTYRVRDVQDSDVLPIGRPLPGRAVYILDRHLQPVPIGVIGELHVGGTVLARGYLNRPELTEEKFIPDPFSDDPQARLFKTEDLARYRSDGNIEFLGRLDHQVKIRGFRIELGEIEVVLTQHPALREAVVNVHEPTPGDKRLAAYVVADSGPVPADIELRQFLKQKLPDYMVPSVFVELEILPLTPSGKVDRRSLPVPDSTRREVESEFVAPRTPIEETLTGVWAEVLGLEKVGIQDNFFELGGHSLHAILVLSRIREVCSADLPIRTLFESPTVAELARDMESGNVNKSDRSHLEEVVSKDEEVGKL